MRQRQKPTKSASVPGLFFRARSLALGCLCLWLLTPSLGAQPRPVLLNAKRDYFAGRLVLVPASTQPEALGMPRQLAQIADHELRTPPLSLLDATQTAALNTWLCAYDFAETDGLLVAVEKLGASAASTLLSVRTRAPHLLIYGFGQSVTAQTMLASGTLDFLLFTGATTVSQDLPADRLAYLSNDHYAAGVLLARWLNQRFGYAPQIALVFSATTDSATLSMLARQVAALGGNLVTLSDASVLRLYVHAPQTTETDRAVLLNAITANTANGLRVALIDAADNADERAALMRELRARKLLDRLASYAAIHTDAPAFGDACQRALTQANLWLIALRFLRDDLERVRRTERHQIAALLSAYLREAIYPAQVQPTLTLTGTLEQREARAQASLRPHAETLFDEQFKRNVHALLLNTGERVEFELRLLQRLQVRFDETSYTPEIRTDVNLVALGAFLTGGGLPRAGWELNDEASQDARLRKRFDAIAWQAFKTDASNVTLTIKLTKAPTASDALAAQGYAINSRRAGATRRLTINAATAQGAFYALAHLEHLGASGQLAQDFQWTEKPALAERGFSESANAKWSQRERLEMLQLAGRARLNVFAYSSRDNNAARLSELKQAAYDNFVTLVNEPAPRFVRQPCETAPLGAWALNAPPLKGQGSGLACAPASARLARLPLASFGAYSWSGKAPNDATTLAATLNWLYGSKAREGLRPWLATNVPTSFAALFDREAAEINAPLLKEKLAQLQATLPQFDTTREQGLLRGVLRAFLQDVQRRLSALADDARYERTESGVYRRRNL